MAVKLSSCGASNTQYLFIMQAIAAVDAQQFDY